MIEGGRFVPGAERVRFEDLAKLLMADHEVNGRRSARAAFGDATAAKTTCAELMRYVADRRKQKAAAATISKKLMAMRTATRA